MNASRNLTITGLLLLAIVAKPATAAAQSRRRQPAQPKIQYERPMNFNGEVVQLRMPFLYARSIDNSEWIIRLEPAVPQDITMKGEAKSSWLQKGMLIRFEAVLNDRLEGTDPVKKFQILMSQPDMPLGVIQDDPVSEDDVLYALVVGEFSRLRDGRLFVRAGKRTVNVRPAEDAVFSIEFFGPRVLETLRPGDKVLGKISPVKDVVGQAKAKTLEFQKTHPLGGQPDPNPRRRPATRRGRGDDDAAHAPGRDEKPPEGDPADNG